jgi:outer membrane protein, multidrug efflux system
MKFLTTRTANNLRPWIKGFLLPLITSSALTGCIVAPKPFTESDRLQLTARVVAGVEQQKTPTKPIDLHNAMARALIHNFASRLDALEEDIARDQFDESFWSFLPQTILTAGATHRDNTLASNSKSITTGTESLELSTSNERTKRNASLRLAWNVLDFGVSYYAARQAADQSLMAQERHKGVVRKLMQDVRSAYWRAAAAQSLLNQVGTMLVKVGKAITKAELIQANRLQKPLDTLNYKRGLYNKLLQLQGLRRTLLNSKLDLAKMMNLSPSQKFTVVLPSKLTSPTREIGADAEELGLRALWSRAELMEAGYNERIAASEVKKAMLRILPGLEFSLGSSYDSNKFQMHDDWNDAGLKLTWNLINFLKAPGDIAIAEKQEAVSILRRQTLGMAILAQVNIAYLDYQESVSTYETTQDLTEINGKIEVIKRQQAASLNLGELELIQTELNSLLSKLKRDEQYAQVQNALGRLIFSTGENLYGTLPKTTNVEELSAALRFRERKWRTSGMFKAKPSALVPVEKLLKTAKTIPAIQPVEKRNIFGILMSFFRANDQAEAGSLKPLKK